jgi:hypothetical protein
MAVTYLHTGDWNIDANGIRGTLRVRDIDELGRISGTLFEQRITGWWSERARRLSFVRAGGDTGGEQGYEGYAWDERPGRGLLRVYHLAGSFETLGGAEGAKDRQTFGWFATLRVILIRASSTCAAICGCDASASTRLRCSRTPRADGRLSSSAGQ